MFTHASSSVTSLAHDAESGELFLAGHADGSLHIYDRRMRSGAVMRSCEGHQSWIQKVAWQKGDRRELVSASVDGTVCVWDVRSSMPTTVLNPQPHGLASLAVHNEAGVFATCVAFV
jgi:regulatory associated protein of mTOR